MSKILKRTKRVPGEPKASDFWRTEKALYEALNAEFYFDCDLAANEANHLHHNWLGPGSRMESSESGFDGSNALAVSWVDLYENTDYHEQRGAAVGYLNSPYSSDLIKAFMAKAAVEAAKGFTTVALVPYTIDTKWWQIVEDHAAEIRRIPHRVAYLKDDGVTKAGAMFGSAVVVFRPQPGVTAGGPRRVTWSYRVAKAAKERV